MKEAHIWNALSVYGDHDLSIRRVFFIRGEHAVAWTDGLLLSNCRSVSPKNIPELKTEYHQESCDQNYGGDSSAGVVELRLALYSPEPYLWKDTKGCQKGWHLIYLSNFKYHKVFDAQLFELIKLYRQIYSYLYHRFFILI